MKSLLFIFVSIYMFALHGDPIKVPNERYWEPDESKRTFKKNFPGNLPFISCLNFRNMSDIVIDDFTEWFDPDSVKIGDIIYLNVWYLDWFAREVHDRIKSPYILVTCDVGRELPPPEAKKLLFDPKCAGWFGRNMIFSYHPKLMQIPMGQDFFIFAFPEPYLMRAMAKKKNLPKQHLLYMNHFPRAWGDRDKIVKLFENAPYCFTKNRSDMPYAYAPVEQYYEDLLSSLFTLSPLGLETDCVRTWEALALDCIPILEHNFLDPLFDQLPVLFVHEWEEINENFLKEKYQEFRALDWTRNQEKIYFAYWENLIKEKQHQVRNREMTFSTLEATQMSEEDLSDLSSILLDHACIQRKQGFCLLYKGFLTAIRALQIAREVPCISKIYLHDVWLDTTIWNCSLDYYLTDHHLLMLKNRVEPLFSEGQFKSILESLNGKRTALFFDLAFYRHSLYWDFENHHRVRHSLKQDLQDIYSKLPSESCTLFCGNMSHNDYVREVLAQFAHENELSIETCGNFWFFKIGRD